jgi:hypothetical protein
MAKIKYIIIDDTRLGKHVVYAKAKSTGTLTFQEMCEKACEKTSIEESFMEAAVKEYMKKAQELLLMGYRVPLGDNFITLRPVLQCSVTDKEDPVTHEVTVATPDMIRPANGISRVAAAVSQKFSKTFAISANWKRDDKATDDEDDEDDATQVTDEPETPPSGGGGTETPPSGGGGNNEDGE